MIKVEGVRIQNFRSFKEGIDSSKFTENRAINVITGKNNAGKTNTLRAVRLFFEPYSYHEETDMNAIKIITKGASKHPIIDITFKDNEISKNVVRYKIRCDLNKPESQNYKLMKLPKSRTTDEEDIEKIQKTFNNSNSIKRYLDNKFKCVFLSTTDEDINTQADNAIKDMILQYYQQQNQAVKKSINDFQKEYESMVDTFKGNFKDLEDSISQGFQALSNDNVEIYPRLNIIKDMEITDFLLNNLSFTIDDSYNQGLESKGAGIQRSALILLNIFLLNKIHTKKNKIILIDEPESFLYPLLISKIKESLEYAAIDKKNNLQVFLTTHSREFLTEIENDNYKYYNIHQTIHEEIYKRSVNPKDIVKKSIITDYNREIKNQVLRNYGLLNQVDDYDEIIICEGLTDSNYLMHLMKECEVIPQVRSSNNYAYDYIGRGAEGIIPILSFLNEVSKVKRKIFILLDGDEEGKKIKRRIEKEKRHFENLKEIKIHILGNDLEIEDKVYSEESFVRNVLDKFSKEFFGRENDFERYISTSQGYSSVIKKTEQFIKDYSINVKIMRIKMELSKNLEESNIRKPDFVEKIFKFFAK